MKFSPWVTIAGQRRAFVVAAIAAFAALSVPCAAAADDYPSHAVKIVVPFAAGGPADIYARFIAQRLQQALKQSFIVDDQPGAGSIIGTEYVAKSDPDGYTLLLMSNTQTVNESLFSKKPYVLMRDFIAVAPINYSDLVLVVKPSLPVASVADLIKLAKSKPGVLNFASSGPGTPYHMAGELFKSMAGVDI
ncbi:MAG: tripartite tricarboxylate transporter substrate-binding protein, partial [Casimicrobiaceae bacterium]